MIDLVQTEKHLSDMVVAKAVYAKIDRPGGIVRFAEPRTTAAVLNTWSRSIGDLLEVSLFPANP